METAKAIEVASSEINEAHRNAKECADTAIEWAVKCGELLSAKKDQLPHGEFIPWLESNCQFSRQSAQAYMKAYRQKARGLAFSSLNKALGYSKQKEKPVKKAEVQTNVVSLDSEERTKTARRNRSRAVRILEILMTAENNALGKWKSPEAAAEFVLENKGNVSWEVKQQLNNLSGFLKALQPWIGSG